MRAIIPKRGVKSICIGQISGENMRIAVFVDYWNFQLTLNERLSKVKKVVDYRSKIDWRALGPSLCASACTVLGHTVGHSYEGTYIYTSFNPATDDGKKFKNWVTTWLDRQPGINVEIRERKAKALPRCPACHLEIAACPHTPCGKPIVATIEKGIDTLLVTDLIRLAVANSYDIAVLASSDADMIPAVDFVQGTLGKKVVQAGFPPIGVDLATQCWGSFDVMAIASTIERPQCLTR
jgi:uncharacterized LabA/DUF88 family protein